VCEQWDCNLQNRIVNAFPVGCIERRPSNYCNFTYLAVSDDVKSVSQLL